MVLPVGAVLLGPLMAKKTKISKKCQNYNILILATLVALTTPLIGCYLRKISQIVILTFFGKFCLLCH